MHIHNKTAHKILLASLALMLAACGQQPSPTAQPDNTTVPATQPPPTAVPPTSAPADTPVPPTATTPAEPKWSSWAAGNTIYTLVQKNGQLYAGGPGGISVWNLADGSLVRRYTSGDGLPSAVVRVVYVDDDGTLWAGTDEGLARFGTDGDVTTYDTTDGLDSNVVSAITRLGGELTIGTYSYLDGGGMVRLKDGAWQVIRGFPSANSDERPGRLSYNVTAILEESPGVVWVGTLNGVGRFDGQEWQRFSTTEGLPNNRVNLLFKDSGGVIWAATDSGAARFNGQQFETFRQLQNSLGGGLYGITQDTAGQYWFAGSGGIVRYKPATADWEQFTQTVDDLPAYTLTRAVLGEDGTLYFGSDGGGVARYTNNNFETWAVPNVPTFSGLRRIVPNPVTGELLFVEENWIRADIYNPASQTWVRMPDLPCNSGCGPLAFDTNGGLWAGSESGLWVMNGSDVTQWTTEFGLPSNVVPALTLTADGKAWVGTDSGLALIENQKVTQVYTSTVGFAGSYIRKIFVASDNSVWASTESNLSRLKPDGTWEHFTAGNPFSYDVQITDIAEDAGGAIWVATYGDSAFRYANGAWTRFDPNDPGVKLPSGYVFAVAAAPDGSVWFGTDSGAARFDGSVWQNYQVKDGLIHHRVLDVHVDAASAVWFATSGGVSRFGP
ncbi:MAG: hypothetical protein JNL09_04235 [Anaerolineales bacterium]|nr:hypothetical protein [Anaerolineales bacterium]